MFRSLVLMVVASVAATYVVRYIDKKLQEREEGANKGYSSRR